LNSPLVGLFSFQAWHGHSLLVSDIPAKDRALKGQIR